MTTAFDPNDTITRFFKENYVWLCGRLQRSTGCPHDAEDIASDTFFKVLTMPQASPVREPRALLTTIAKRLMFEKWRRRDLERAYIQSLADSAPQTHPSPEERILLIEALQRLDTVLDSLPGQGKAAFVHSQFGGLTYPEIAQRLGISLSRVQQYMTQAFALCYLNTLQ